MIGLTPRQADLLRFIVGFVEARGYSPSFRECEAGIGSASRHSINDILISLEERQWIIREPNMARTIRLLATVPIPRGPAGEPLFSVRLKEPAR